MKGRVYRLRLGLTTGKAFPGDASIRAKRTFEGTLHYGVPIAEEETILLSALGKDPLYVDGVPMNGNGTRGGLVGEGRFPWRKKAHGHFMVLVILVVVKSPKPGATESGQCGLFFLLFLPLGDERTLCEKDFIGLVL